jgi:hypothetical protein
MDFRFAFVAISACIAAYGCAVPEQQSAASSATQPQQPQQQTRYVTGSRIPVRDEDTGASSVSSASKEAYQEAVQNMNAGSSGK